MDLMNSTLNVTLMPSELPSAAPSALPSDFACDDRGDPEAIYPYICYPKNLTAAYGVDERLAKTLGLNEENNTDLFYPLFECRGTAFSGDAPNSADCGNFCALIYNPAESERQICNSCTLSGTELIYDCRNILNEEVTANKLADTCAARNVEGECKDFVHWQCFEENLGFVCRHNNRASMEQDNVFPFDTVLRSEAILYCASDISGLSAAACEQPRCNIATFNPNAACDQCKVLANNETTPYDFSYSCTTFENLTCPILDESGSCVKIVYEKETNDNIIGINFPTPPAQGNEDDANNDWTWTIVDVDPTTFNVLSDLFGYATRVVFGFTVAAFFPVLMTWQIRKNSDVPLQALWPAPGDFVQAVATTRVLACSTPILMLALLLFLGDFCHTLADFGFDFVEQTESGSLQTILRLSRTTEDRNMARSMVTSGDSSIARATVINVANDEGRINESRDQTELKNSFLSAVTLIARGASPFVLEAPRPWRETLGFGGVAFNAYYMPDGSPLAALDQQIPLECLGNAYAVIPEVMLGFGVFDNPIYNTAIIPNCTFSGARSSGVYGNELSYAEIVEQVAFNGIATGLGGVGTGKQILLRKGNKSFQEFTLNPSQKLLARDRENWKAGRLVENAFDTLEIGNLTIDLGRVVVASGADSSAGETIYAFVGEVVGDCPERPSGLSAANTECFTVIEASCGTFQEDFGNYHELYSPFTTTSECRLTRVSMSWGRNFVMDAELTTVVAGIYGLVKPEYLGSGSRVFDRHAILAALFLLGTIEEQPSIQAVVRAQVNIQYIVFMLLPVVLSIFLLLIAINTRKDQIPIPRSAWDLMVLGQEQMIAPKRASQASPFPKQPKDLHLIFDESAALGVERSSWMASTSPTKKNVTVDFGAPKDGKGSNTSSDKELSLGEKNVATDIKSSDEEDNSSEMRSK